MPTTPARKHPIKVHAAALGEKPALSKELFDDGSMLYKDEKSLVGGVSMRHTAQNTVGAHHDPKTKTERRG